MGCLSLLTSFGYDFSALTPLQKVPGSGKVKFKTTEKSIILNFSQSARGDETWKWNLACRRRINQAVFALVRRGNKFYEREKESERFHNFLFAAVTIHIFTIRVYTLDFSRGLCVGGRASKLILLLLLSSRTNLIEEFFAVCALSRGEKTHRDIRMNGTRKINP